MIAIEMVKYTIILGIIQGLTEFLPISSSGHLALLENILQMERPGLLFNVLLHFGTLISVLYVFRRRIWLLIISPFSRDENFRFLLLIIVATLPTAVMGFLLESWVERAFEGVLIVGINLMLTGGLLYLVERARQGEKEIVSMSFLEATLIGIMQGFAIFPGVSRSGFTIAMGMLIGLRREIAAEFSFILAIPAILGATLLEGIEASRNPTLHGDLLSSYALGTLLACLTGILAIRFLLKILRERRLDLFSYYCWGVGIIAIALSFII